MLEFAEVMVGEPGGPVCARCDGSSRSERFRDADEVAEEIHAALASDSLTTGRNLSLAGAEPMRHPALPRILAAAVDAGVERLRLESDCEAFGATEAASDALERGVRHVRFPLLGPTPDTHDSLVGRPGAFEATLNGVRALAALASERELAVHITARMPVCRHNLSLAPTVVTAAAEAGAAAVLLAMSDPRLDLAAAAPWIEAACDSGIVNTVWVEVEGVPFRAASGWSLHLAATYRRREEERLPEDVLRGFRPPLCEVQDG